MAETKSNQVLTVPVTINFNDFEELNKQLNRLAEVIAEANSIIGTIKEISVDVKIGCYDAAETSDNANKDVPVSKLKQKQIADIPSVYYSIEENETLIINQVKEIVHMFSARKMNYRQAIAVLEIVQKEIKECTLVY